MPRIRKDIYIYIRMPSAPTHPVLRPADRGTPVSPSPILIAATEKDRFTGSLLARSNGLMDWRSIVGGREVSDSGTLCSLA